AGRHTSLGIRSDHTLWAWGNNDSGQVGDGTTINKLSPVQITTNSDWLAVSGGDGLTLAVKANGSLWAWGDHDLGGLSVERRPSPIQIGQENNWIEVSAGNL